MSRHLHTYTLPSGKDVTLRELTVGDLEEILERLAASGKDALRVRAAEQRARRVEALVAVDGVRVGRDVLAQDLLAKLGPKDVDAIDLAISRLHDLQASEAEAFLRSHRAGEVVAPLTPR